MQNKLVAVRIETIPAECYMALSTDLLMCTSSEDSPAKTTTSLEYCKPGACRKIVTGTCTGRENCKGGMQPMAKGLAGILPLESDDMPCRAGAAYLRRIQPAARGLEGQQSMPGIFGSSRV